MNFSGTFFVALCFLSCGAPQPAHQHGTSDAGAEEPFDAGNSSAVDAGSADAGTTDAGPRLPGVPVLISVASVSHAMAISCPRAPAPSSACG